MPSLPFPCSPLPFPVCWHPVVPLPGNETWVGIGSTGLRVSSPCLFRFPLVGCTPLRNVLVRAVIARCFVFRPLAFPWRLLLLDVVVASPRAPWCPPGLLRHQGAVFCRSVKFFDVACRLATMIILPRLRVVVLRGDCLWFSPITCFLDVSR